MQLYRKYFVSLFWALLSCSIGWFVLEGISPKEAPLRKVAFPKEAKWITNHDELQPSGCYRLDFDINQKINQAWVQIASEAGFELICNGNPVGSQSHWRPTRPFQNGLTEWGQKINPIAPLMALNFSREYQWDDHQNEALAIYFDLTPYLRKGRNTICVNAEARQPKQAFRLFGEVKTASSEIIPLFSNTKWKAEPIPLGYNQGDWVKSYSSVSHWKYAIEAQRSQQHSYSLVPHATFTKPFDARWIKLKSSSEPFLKHQYTFEAKSSISDAVLRCATNSPFRFLVNGTLLPSLPREQEPFWYVNWSGRASLNGTPELLDPDETAGFFNGSDFLTPTNSDPTVNNLKRTELSINKTKDRDSSYKSQEEDRSQLEKGTISNIKETIQEPASPIPLALTRPLASYTYRAYHLRDLIQTGTNTLEIIFPNQNYSNYKAGKDITFAYDLWEGSQRVLNSGSQDSQAAIFTQVKANASFPLLKFVGSASNSWSRMWCVVLACVIFIISVKFQWKKPHEWVILFLSTLLLTLVLRSAFQEQSELIWFRKPWWAFKAIILSAMIASIIYQLKNINLSFITGSKVVLIFIILCCGLLRFWRADYQPIDDDEFASMQAALSIADVGVPTLAPGIYYTRSPLYHYLAGFVAWLLGGNVFSLRLFSVITAMGTCWLIWRVALFVFKNKLLAFISAILFCIHPFLVFSGHIARFYQLQQFFVLLTIFFFFKGFVAKKDDLNMKIAAIFSFGCAVLSQEISITLVVPLFVFWLVMGSPIRIERDWKCLLAMIAVGFMIFIDVIIFKVLCITRPVGVSPNVEATIAPNLWEISNFFSIFTANSRLHLALSFFIPLSILESIRRKNHFILGLHFIFIWSIITANLLITSVSFRYQYSLIPIWILLGVHGVFVAAYALAKITGLKSMRAPMIGLITSFVILSWSPWRIPPSYSLKILGDPISALRYVKSNMQEQDKIMITEPHPHAALIELGRVDYDLSIPLLYDFTYSDEGTLRDRNGNAQAINQLSQIQNLFAKHSRMWIIINREKLRSRKQNIRWEYPGARIESFFRQNCKLAYRAYLFDVYLWDQSFGYYEGFRKEPLEWIE